MLDITHVKNSMSLTLTEITNLQIQHTSFWELNVRPK